MWLYVVLLLVFLSLYAGVTRLIKSLWFVIPPSKGAKQIFSKELVTNPPVNEEIEFDTAKRDKILKNGFSPDKVPDRPDAIFIGSGIGSLTTAALLARAGKKVLVLEQHDQAGGCCHVFAEKGFEFDVGIHYIGFLKEGSFLRLLCDQLSNGNLQWVPIDAIYDIVALGANYERQYPMESGRDNQMNFLIKKFPKEEEGIRKFYYHVRESGKGMMVLAFLKCLPKVLVKFLLVTGLMQRAFPALKYLKKTVSQVLDEITSNKELRAILSYSFGDFGTPPNEAPFMMQGVLINHFLERSYYPRGGASEIAYNIIPVIESMGGRVLVRARVKEILLNDTQDCAIGIRVLKGKQEYEIFAPLIVSDAGVINTFKTLLPKQVVTKFNMDKVFSSLKPGHALLSVFIGLDGTKEELGLEAKNIWAFQSSDLVNELERYFALTPDEARSMDIPLLFLSFPSAKDPTFNIRYPGKSTCAIITMAPYKWFEEWKNDKVMHRGEDYDSLKMDIGRRMWQQALKMYPHLEDKMEYIDVGTPLSNQYYLNTYKGEVYGLDHDVNRFDPFVLAELRPETALPGLYLTGQDSYCCGYSGSMMGGLFSASAILKRNLMMDIMKLRAVWKKTKKIN